MTTITANSTVEVFLSTPAYSNPVVVNSGVTITNSGLAVAGASGYYWSLQNHGRIIGTGTNGFGVALTSGGMLTNAAGGYIAGGSSGVDVAGSVVNYGSIAGISINSAGVALPFGATLNNTGSGIVTGIGAGVRSAYFGSGSAAATAVINAGSINSTGTSAIAVMLSAGSVTNLATGTISASGIGAEAATLINSGSVTGTGTSGTGVALAASGGRVTNQSSGTITGVSEGLQISGTSAVVVNYGSIAATGTASIGSSGIGVAISQGTLSNAASGIITGSADGVAGFFFATGSISPETVINAGTIRATGTFATGIFLSSGGSATNTGSGTISGSRYGINVGSGAGTIVNAGIISAGTTSGAIGVRLSAGSSLTNQSGGTISGAESVLFTAGSGNRLAIAPGAVFSNAVDGGNTIGSTAVSTLELMPGATNGTLSGLGTQFIDFAAITVDAGATWALPGVVTLAAGATLGGSGHVIATGSLNNRGMVSAAVTLAVGTSFTNQSGGTVAGSGHAALAGTTGATATVVNAGLIDPATYGIYLPGGGVITNTAGGTIDGSAVGIQISGGAGTVVNAGTITGTTDAVKFAIGYSNRLVVNPGAAFNGGIDGGNPIGTGAVSTLELASGNQGTLSGFGTLVTNFGSIVIDPSASWFIAGDTTGLAGTISGFSHRDTIELTGVTATGSSFAGGILTLSEAAGSVTLALPGPFATSDFTVTNVSGGVLVGLEPPGQFVWTGTVDANFSNPLNWNDTTSGQNPATTAPAANDAAIIAPGTAQINSGTVAITDLSLGGTLNGPTSGDGTLAVLAGAALQMSDEAAVWNASTLSVDAASSVDIGTTGSTTAGAILVETGHTLYGDGLIAAAVINNGSIVATNNGTFAASTGGSLEVQGAISGTGTLNIEPGATLQLDGALGSGQTINFVPGGAPETLIIGSPTGTIANPIIGFAQGDRIEFGNTITINSVTVPNGTIAVVNHNSLGVVGTYDLTNVTFAPNTPLSNFTMNPDPITNDSGFFPTHFFTWNGSSGTNFTTAANWNFGTLVPGVLDDTQFTSSAGGTISGNDSVAFLFFDNVGTWSLAAGTSLAATIGFSLGGGGGGAASAGNLVIGNGSTITTGGGFINIGNNAGNVATLTVSGGGVLRQTVPSYPINYTMSIGSSPDSGTLAASHGSVLVTGAGSQIDLGSNGMVIASNGGIGSVTVAQGGSIHAGAVNSTVNNSFAIGRRGNGTLTVTDPGSQVSANGIAYVAHTTTGTLLVENSGTFLALPDSLGVAGLIIGLGSTIGVGGIGTGTVTTDGVLISQGYVDVGLRGTDGTLSVINDGTVEVGTILQVGIGGTIQNGSIYGANGTLAIGAGGTVELTGGAQTSTYGIELASANNGTLTTSTALVTVSGAGALLNADGNGIEIGRFGSATLTVSQGGSVAAGTQDSSQIKALAIGTRGGNGTVTVTDANSEFTANGGGSIGSTGSGSLLVENQGTVSFGLDGKGGGALAIGSPALGSSNTLFTGGAGSASVIGNGVLSSQPNILVGGDGASGVLTINTGGTVIAGQQVLIGNSASFATAGTVVTPFATIAAAAGSVVASSGSIDIGPAGTLQFTGPPVQGQASVIIGNGAGATGVATVHGAGAMLATGGGPIAVGGASSGSLTIGQGAKVMAGIGFAADQAVHLGGIADVTGVLTVTDAGSGLTASGQLDVGEAGNGQLTVQNQATVTTGNSSVDAAQGIDIATGTGGSGSATIAGNKSLLSNTGRFVVGDQGFANLAIQGGGTVITAPGTVAGLAGADIAAHAGSDGSNVSVTGNGSNWQITGNLLVGDAAAGSLAITAGGAVTASQADIGVQSSGSGNLSVTGTNSNLALAGQLTVGDAASAELSILGGGMVSANNADIGLNAGSTGNVDIEGAGSHLDVANDLNIGDAGVGVLTLGNGTELTVGNNLVVGANGVLNQFGGAIDPSTITIVAGGRQGGHGTSTASVLISNAGTLFASSGTETVITPLITAPSGKSGVLEIDAGGNMVLNVTSVDATQSVSFTDGTGILTIGTIGGFAASIVGVNAGDQIIVQGKSIASDGFNASTHVLTLFDGSSATIGTLQLGPSVDGSAILANGTGGLGVAPCFMAGTRISTERGEVAVEDLRIRDRVQVLGGKTQHVVWIGHRAVNCTRHPDPRKVWPVRVSAGAFGLGRPARDLWLSPDHAVYVGDVFIPVKHLVNGSSIAQVPRDEVAYYHVELPAHSVLLAENLPAESYLDTGDRSNFTNGGGAIALYPDLASRLWEAEGCAPLVVTGPALEATRRWVNALAGVTEASAAATVREDHLPGRTAA